MLALLTLARLKEETPERLGQLAAATERMAARHRMLFIILQDNIVLRLKKNYYHLLRFFPNGIA